MAMLGILYPQRHRFTPGFSIILPIFFPYSRPLPTPSVPSSAGPYLAYSPCGCLMPSAESDSSDILLGRARDGDDLALGQLLEGYRNYLALLARLGVGRRLQGKVDPDDAVQETFLKAHRDFAVFRGATAAEFTAWLRQILAWTLANLVRRFAGTGKRDLRLERGLADDLDRSRKRGQVSLL